MNQPDFDRTGPDEKNPSGSNSGMRDDLLQSRKKMNGVLWTTEKSKDGSQTTILFFVLLYEDSRDIFFFSRFLLLHILQDKCARYWPELHTTKTYGLVIVENLSEANYGPAQTPNNTPRVLRSLPSAGYQLQQQTSNDNDCCYRLRTLKITTEEGKTWEILHWQYLAWGDHGKHKKYFFLSIIVILKILHLYQINAIMFNLVYFLNFLKTLVVQIQLELK
jgi:hypothetical protein